MIKKKRIGLTMRINETLEYADIRDAISQDWINLSYKLKFFPILIPNSKVVNNQYLTELKLDGLILTNGGLTNLIRKGKYKKISNQRDYTEVESFNFALKKNIPILGVCRGMQFIFKYYGGKIKKIHDKSHVAKKSHIIFTNGEKRRVICYHDFTCSNVTLPKSLIVTAFSKDGKIEAFEHRSKKILGIQWHPERTHQSQKSDFKMIKKFFSIY